MSVARLTRPEQDDGPGDRRADAAARSDAPDGAGRCRSARYTSAPWCPRGSVRGRPSLRSGPAVGGRSRRSAATTATRRGRCSLLDDVDGLRLRAAGTCLATADLGVAHEVLGRRRCCRVGATDAAVQCHPRCRGRRRRSPGRAPPAGCAARWSPPGSAPRPWCPTRWPVAGCRRGHRLVVALGGVEQAVVRGFAHDPTLREPRRPQGERPAYPRLVAALSTARAQDRPRSCSAAASRTQVATASIASLTWSSGGKVGASRMLRSRGSSPWGKDAAGRGERDPGLLGQLDHARRGAVERRRG